MKILKITIIMMLAISACAAGAYVRLQSFLNPDAKEMIEILNIHQGEPLQNESQRDESPEVESPQFESSTELYILVAGLDNTDGTERSDSLGIAVIDIDSKKVKFMSIPRDSRVFIPRKGWDKINHAYAYGKIDLLKETIINTFNLPIHYYFVLNFKSFPAIIDSIGGVTIDVEKRMVYHDYSGNLHIDIPKGFQTLNGKNALHYVRFRHDSLNDFGRIERQQKFTKEVVRKMQSPSILPKFPDLIREAINMVITDMTPAQAIQLASYLRDIKESDLKFFTVPGKAAYIGALSYWIPDIPAASMMLADQYVPDSPDDGRIDYNEIREDLPYLVSKINRKISILNGDGAKLIGKRASEEFQQIGIDVGMTGNAKHFDYRYSCIVIPTNGNLDDMESAEALAALCGIDKKLISKSSSTSSVTIILGKDKEKVFSNLRVAATKE
ncbi:MAG: LCP family protein [Synergistaceae bacterium]|nr:LCP family protein [Synergistaceae bacterium]